ncbi:MAG: hypothetical protein AUI12_09300 [Acidobacteria bacterium 13_2_20CM_2_57_6]|nr:MAG: hypothetical protein AUI12_09300 [Acidobacteria bacterium 13_2_20CM_2_57_6]
MANRLQMIPENTRMEANGEGAAFDITGSATRTFLCRLTVTDQIEQESLDVSIWGSADGETWTKKPLLKLPQQFYRGTTKLILDLSLRQETKFIRASWELNRWGRVAPSVEWRIRLSNFDGQSLASKFQISCVISGDSGHLGVGG